MRDTKFRYVLKHKENSSIEIMCLTLEQIEKTLLDYIEYDNGKCRHPNCVIGYNDCRSCNKGNLLNDYEIITRDQYTGLKDKNGVEIYENDIVCLNAADFTGEEKEIKCVVQWERQQWTHLLHPCKVIGNIHENPELKGELYENK